jgi:hypothetical protein
MRVVIDRRARYRLIRLAVLGMGLIAGVGYPLALTLGGAALVAVHPGSRGATISVHNARPWLVVAAGAGLLLLVELLAARRASSAVATADRPPDGQDARLAQELHRVGEEKERLLAGRRSEREWNAALDAHLASLWAVHVPGDVATLAELVLDLTMELVDAPTGVLALDADAGLVIAASRGIDDPQAAATGLAAQRGVHGVGTVDEDGETWLVLSIDGEGRRVGLIALTGLPEDPGGLDRDVLAAVARRAAALLREAAPRAPS